MQWRENKQFRKTVLVREHTRRDCCQAVRVESECERSGKRGNEKIGKKKEDSERRETSENGRVK